MEKVRGIAFFEDKTLDEVKDALKDVEMEKAELAFFESIERNDEKYEHAGVLIDGEIDGMSSVELVQMLRKKFELEEALLCDVSIESEAMIKQLKKGKLEGHYCSIRVMPPYEIEKVYTAAEKLGSSLKASNILVRTAEEIDEKPVACIDIISKEEYNVDAAFHLEDLQLGFLTKFEIE